MKTYFIQAQESGFVKIGRARDPRARMKELQVGNPETLKLLAQVPADIEKEMHERFQLAWVNGEWHKPTFSLMDFIEIADEAFFLTPLPRNHGSLMERLTWLQAQIETLENEIYAQQNPRNLMDDIAVPRLRKRLLMIREGFFELAESIREVHSSPKDLKPTRPLTRNDARGCFRDTMTQEQMERSLKKAQ